MRVQSIRRYATADALRDDLARIAARRKKFRFFPPNDSAWNLCGVDRRSVGGPLFPTRPKTPVGPATASITTEPAGAMVVLGDRMERSPATFRDLAPGKYPLRLMLPDFDPLETELSIGPAQTYCRHLQVEAKHRFSAAFLGAGRSGV